jgi:magnesium transporter
LPNPEIAALSRQVITELLNRQKLVEGMVHNQPMQKHELVEAVVQKQHLAELRSHLERLGPAETGALLEALPREDAFRLWGLMDDGRDYDVLWEIQDDLRERLEAVRKPNSGKGQLSAFELVGGRLERVMITSRHDLERVRPIWIDLLNASRSQRTLIGEHFGIALPNPESVTDLELSARCFIGDANEVHLHSDFLLERDEGPVLVPVAFVLHGDILFSLRNEDLPVFRLQRFRARKEVGYVSDCRDVLLDLYGADVEYCADILEGIYTVLNRVGREVLNLRLSDSDAGRILAEIAHEEQRNGRIRHNVLDMQRAVSFLMRSRVLHADQIEEVQQIFRDIESLNGHTTFLFDKINFLLDATVGFINVNQNKVIKIFSVASVAMLPPTLIASIYGMNFHFMPELDWEFGYPFSLGLMALSVLLPFWYFNRRGWLK